MTSSPHSCNCRHCISERDKANPPDAWPTLATMMVLCPICGNKRCPRATHHKNACTGSNEPGQPGSVYA